MKINQHSYHNNTQFSPSQLLQETFCPITVAPRDNLSVTTTPRDNLPHHSSFWRQFAPWQLPLGTICTITATSGDNLPHHSCLWGQFAPSQLLATSQLLQGTILPIYSCSRGQLASSQLLPGTIFPITAGPRDNLLYHSCSQGQFSLS